MYVTINVHKIIDSFYCGFVMQIKIAWKDYYGSLSLDEEPKMRGEVEQQLGSTQSPAFECMSRVKLS